MSGEKSYRRSGRVRYTSEAVKDGHRGKIFPMSQSTLGQPHATPELSLDEWFGLPEDEPGELVAGRLEEEEVPDYLHELLVALLGHSLGNWIFPRGGLVAGSGAKFAVGSGRGRKPDLTVYLPGGRRPPARGLIRVPPDIAVEIVSPTPRAGARPRRALGGDRFS